MSSDVQIRINALKAGKDEAKDIYATKAVLRFAFVLFIVGSVMFFNLIGGLFMAAICTAFVGIFVYEEAENDFEKEFNKKLEQLQQEYRHG